MGITIGIDLGTTTTIVSVMEDGKPVPVPRQKSKSPLMPSVVGLNRKGELVVGEDAKQWWPQVRESKREMGTDKTFDLGAHNLRPEEVAALILKEAVSTAETYTGERVDSAVITVPAYFGDLERRATQNAAEIAGLDVIRLINEPTAAALAFGSANLSREETLLVFDLGGGTLDVTILEMYEGVLDVRASHGDKRLGGADMDRAIAQWAAQAQAIYVGTEPQDQLSVDLINASERGKIALSDNEVTDIWVQNIVSTGQAGDLDLALSRPTFQKLIDPLIQRSLAVIDEALLKAKMEKSQISQVLLVGGGTYVPAISEAVGRHLEVPRVRGVNPDLAVSMGACISANLATGTIAPSAAAIVQDACTHGLGVLVIQDVGDREMLVFDQLIPPGQPIPYAITRQYSLRRPDQTSMGMELREDPTGRAVLPEDTIETGTEGEISGIPPALYGTPHTVEVIFTYDQNHVAKLKATIVGTGKDMVLISKRNPKLLDASGISQSIGSVDQLWQSSPLASRHQSMIRRAEKVLEGRPPNFEQLEAVLVELKTKISTGDSEGAQRAREKLVELLDV